MDTVEVGRLIAGIVLVIITLIVAIILIKIAGSPVSTKLGYEQLNLLYLDREKHKKYIRIDTRHLSAYTVDIIRYNTQDALLKLYKLAKENGKEDLYATFEGHIALIGSELSDAVQACVTPEMEKCLMQQMIVVAQTLNVMEKELRAEIEKDAQERVQEQKDIQEMQEKVEKITEDELTRDYHPMKTLEIFNDLLKEDQISK